MVTIDRYLILIIFIVVTSCRKQKAFSSDEWKSNPEVRLSMVDDLKNSGVLKGKTKDQVIKLLGSDCKHCESESNSWMYYVDLRKGITNPNLTILDITFENNRVFECSLRQ